MYGECSSDRFGRFFGGHFGRFHSVGEEIFVYRGAVRAVLSDFGGHCGRFRSVEGRSPGTDVRSGPVCTVLAVISVDSGRLRGDLRVRRVRSGPVCKVLAVILVDSDRLGGRSPCTERTVRTGLDAFGGQASSPLLLADVLSRATF